jgi:hypothetical protein
MVRTERRQFLKAAGAGTGVALGAGAASAQESSDDEVSTSQTVAATFNGAATDGFLVIDGNSPTDSNASANVSISELGGEVTINGEVYEDKTWSSTNVSFPDLKAADIVDFSDLPVGPGDLTTDDIQVLVDPIDGTYDPQQGLVTGDIFLTIDAQIVASLFGITAEFDFTIDFNDGNAVTLTTGQSGSLEGSAQNLASTGGTVATVVNNNYTVPKAEGQVEANPPFVDPINVNDELNLPSNDPSRNFIELVLDITWQNGPPTGLLPPIPDPIEPGFQGPPKDEDGDGLLENVRGGSGPPTVLDVQALFNNLTNDTVQNNADKFNFQGDDPSEVGILDVQSLYDKHVNN